VIETATNYSARELDAMSDLITREFCGRTLFEVRERLMEAMAEEKAACDRVLARALELGQRALEGNEGHEQIYVDGTAQLLDKPEFSDVDSLRRVFRTFEEKARLLDLMTRYLDSKTACVVLGSEEDVASDPRLSAVLTSYGTGETLAGTLGVIGPARREYPRVIPVVELLGRALSERLERRERREKEGAPR
jgi:heat-inducible transcriptional repressor